MKDRSTEEIASDLLGSLRTADAMYPDGIASAVRAWVNHTDRCVFVRLAGLLSELEEVLKDEK